MSFSTLAKDDLVRVISHRTCCTLAEFTAFLRLSGTINIGSNNAISITITTEHPSAARKVLTMAKELFGLQTEVIVHRKARLRKNQVFAIHIPPQEGVVKVLELLGIALEDQLWQEHRPEAVDKKILEKSCCQRAYLRGAFLAAGSVNDPGGQYHLEISCNDNRQARLLQRLMEKSGMHAHITRRKNSFVVYLKEGSQIGLFLTVVGSHRSLLEFENIRIVKEMRNQVNRVVNCERANINKTVDAALQQMRSIEKIDQKIGINSLAQPLRETALARLENPESSLDELAKILGLGRSCVNHRLRKITKIAEELD